MEDQEDLLHSLGAHVDALMAHQAAGRSMQQQQRLAGGSGGGGGPRGEAEATAVASELRRVQGRVAELEGMLEEGRRAAMAAKQVRGGGGCYGLLSALAGGGKMP